MSIRQTEHLIHSLFTDRWSPRAFGAETLDRSLLESLLEAARWAPSAYNAQPWRFVYALRDTPEWAGFLDLLLPFNQRWAGNASALLFVLSKRSFLAPGKQEAEALPSHAFDTGAAWANLALQATHAGLATHAMGGFDRVRARSLLEVPEDYEFQVAVAIGYRGAREALPEDLQAREAPSSRESLAKLASEGRFSL
jgi:nitroreductase